ncbi:MAG: hypothetical protein C3F11_06620 [Methylocystaceae bacterium]|nr:MAG: hypothetical protein C3F11_06620 [Methylocystaceae bacterium]
MRYATSPKPKIAIVGGGFSGAAVAARLLRSTKYDVEMIESRPRVGPGLAYGDAQPYHILNVPAGRMSFWTERPRHFLEWAKRNGPELGWPEAAMAEAHSYLPRELYGFYVAEQLERTDREVSEYHGRRLLHRRATAMTLDHDRDVFRLALDNGESVRAEAVIIATGHGRPTRSWQVTGRGAAYVEYPWSKEATAHLNSVAPVLIIGTGLTMVDTVLRLKREGHCGHITAISRHGLMPRRRGDSEACVLELGVREASFGVRCLFEAAREAISRNRGDWQAVVDGLRPISEHLWSALSLTEKRRWLRHVQPIWNVHRHRMPEESAETIAALIAEDRLEVSACFVEEIEMSGMEARVRLRPRGTTRSRTHTFGRVINCTPGRSDLASMGSPLLADMEKKGLARANALRCGLDCDESGALLDALGRRLSGAFALGPMRRGLLFEASAVPDICCQADDLAQVVAAFLSSDDRQPKERDVHAIGLAR